MLYTYTYRYLHAYSKKSCIHTYWLECMYARMHMVGWADWQSGKRAGQLAGRQTDRQAIMVFGICISSITAYSL